ncbi:hypothetical protein BGZ83_004927 [Gryganskiella cystojenkinii]|nr:hypothetical protein BGZ83_004927 [Gryganskiella cystojenkinii]
MSTQSLPPRRIADYFFMVGLKDDFWLDGLPLDEEDEGIDSSEDTRHYSDPSSSSSPPTSPSTAKGGEHGSLGHGNTTMGTGNLTNSTTRDSSSTVPSPSSSSGTGPNETKSSDQGSFRSPGRSRSKSMAHVNNHSVLPPHRVNFPSNSSGTEQFIPERPPVPRRPRASTVSSKRPPRRAVTMSDISAGESNSTTGLQHKPSYRHVSAGTLFKTVQEGIQRELTRDMIPEHGDHGDDDEDNDDTISLNESIVEKLTRRVGIESQAGPVAPRRHEAYSTTIPRPIQESAQDMKNLAFGKNMAMIRSRSKIVHGGALNPAEFECNGSANLQEDIHPGERVFSPAVTCRYPTVDWPDSESFPNHLSLSESEMEYAKAIKTKISREKALLRELRARFQEEKTLGRKARLVELQREIIDSEEKLFLLEDQMKPWRKLFVEAEDVWMPRCIGLVSAIPYHYLLRDWLLAVVVACSGGVEHPGMSVSSLRLESYVRNIIHDVNVPPFGKLEIGITINNRLIYASRPALNSVPIVKNFSLFPLFRCLSAEDIVTVIEACVVDLDKGTINVQLPPMQLPPRPRRKLIQSLEQYAPTCALRRSTTTPRNDSLGPPEYVKVAFPHSRLTLFCGVSRAPRWNRRPDPPRPPMASTLSTLTANSTMSGMNGYSGNGGITGGSNNIGGNNYSQSVTTISPSVSRKSSSNTLGQQSVTGMSMSNGSTKALPKIPKVDFEKETLLEGSLIDPDFGTEKQQSKPLQPATSEQLQGLAITNGAKDDRRMSMDVAIDGDDKLANGKDEQLNNAARKMLSPMRARAGIFDMPKKQPESTSRPQSQTQQQLMQLQEQQSSQSQPIIPPPANTNISRPTINRSNSYQSHSNGHPLTNLENNSTSNTANVNGSGGYLSHRASLTSIESSSSSLHPRSSTLSQFGQGKSGSPISTMTSNTMGSINGPSSSQVSTPTLQSGQMLPPPFLPTPAYTIPKPGETGPDSVMESGMATENVQETPSAPVIKEGHVLASVSSPVPLSLIQSSRCGICSHGLAAHQMVSRCEGCSLYVHAGCIDELLYPCVPRGFDESGICWSVLQMWAGLMKGYRSGILAGAAAVLQQQQLQHQQHLLQIQQQQQLQLQAQNQRNLGHSKQLSSSGSENDVTTAASTASNSGSRDRLSWASFRGWTTRSLSGTPVSSTNNAGGSSISNGGGQANNSTNNNARATTSFSPPAPRASTTIESASYHDQPPPSHRQQAFTRARSGTQGSAHSDTVRFHRDVFMKSVDREARPFMSAFTESQAFVQFVQDRVDRSPGDPEIMFFDEVIKAKINRSRFRLGKEETKFLDDPTYGIQGTVKAMPPSGEHQPHDKTLRRFPTSLNPALMV